MRRDNAPSAVWVSISAYARIYGIDRATVYKWLALPAGAAVLEVYRVGRCVRVKNQPPKGQSSAAHAR